MLAKTMLYIAGLTQNIWGILVDTIEVDEHEVEDYLAQGWFYHPFEVRDAAAAEALETKKPADPSELELLRQQLAENQRLLDEANLKLSQAPSVLVQGAQTFIPGPNSSGGENTAGDPNAGQPEVKEPTPEEVELELKLKLAEEAAKKGVKIDGRWNSTKIQAALEKAAGGA